MRSPQNDKLILRMLAEKSAICSIIKVGWQSSDFFLQAGEFCKKVTPTVSVRLIHAHKNCIVK